MVVEPVLTAVADGMPAFCLDAWPDPTHVQPAWVGGV